jgi:hypothetical protein
MKAKKERPTRNRARLGKTSSSASLWETGPKVKSESRTPAPEPLESYTPEEIERLAYEAVRDYHREYQRANRERCKRYRLKSALKRRYGQEVAERLMAEWDRATAERRQAGILPDQEEARTLPPGFEWP